MTTSQHIEGLFSVYRYVDRYWKSFTSERLFDHKDIPCVVFHEENFHGSHRVHHLVRIGPNRYGFVP